MKANEKTTAKAVKENKGVNANAEREVSQFLQNWRSIKTSMGGANWAYRAVYECATPEFKRAMIDPKTLFKGGEKYHQYVAYVNEHKGAKGVSAWFAYLWVVAEMRETAANSSDERAKYCAQVLRIKKAEKQGAKVAKEPKSASK